MFLAAFKRAIAILFIMGVAVHGVSAAEKIGQIKVASGDVTIERGGQKLPAAPGIELFENDVVATGEASAVGMTFTDNSRMSFLK